MEYLLGGLVVITVLAFVVLPLVRRQQPLTPPNNTFEPAYERAEVYRELLELELDQKVGKLAESDFQEQSDALLARAAALISQEDSRLTSADAAIEREIAEARAALRERSADPAPSIPAPSTPSEETRA